MQPRTMIRRAAVALAAVVTSAVAISAPAEALIDTDSVRLTETDIDFGGSLFGAGVPVGSGSVEWDIIDGFYTPRLVGTIHLDNASGKYARMHISYWSGGDELIDIRHSRTRQAPNNNHHSWPVDVSPQTLMQITEVHVCLEISNNGVDFTQPDCTNAIYLY